MSATPVTRAIREALRTRFSGPEWACFFEVPVGTGFNGRDRLADAIAMNMYPSRGLSVHGVEIKASRGDWLRELRTPDKAEAMARYCDFWWIAAPHNMVKAEELPPTWGLLELSGSGLRQRIAAPRLKPEALGRSFIASLLRCAAGRANAELREAVDKATSDAQAKAAGVVQADRETRRKAAEYDRLKENVDAFEAASGLQISDMWGGGSAETGRVVKLVRDLGFTSTWGLARRMAQEARAFADKADLLLAEFPKNREGEE